MLLHEISTERIHLHNEWADEKHLTAGRGFFAVYLTDFDFTRMSDDPEIAARMKKVKSKVFGMGPFVTYNKVTAELDWLEIEGSDIKYGTFDGTYLTPEKAPED